MMNNPDRKGNQYFPSSQEINELLLCVADSDYIEYITTINGGYYYADSLQLYSVSDDDHDLIAINLCISKLYGEIYDQLFSFGQDTFGNQFSFNQSGQIVLFNIETGETEYLADSFASWQDELLKDFEYLTGVEIRKKFAGNKASYLKCTDRLCPKIPFVIGGEFEIENLYSIPLFDCLNVNSNIAKQLYDKPDGTSVIIKNIE